MKAFYGSLLGLDVLEDQPSQLSFQAGETVLAFRECSPMENSFYHVAFTIPTNKLEEAKQWMSERGIPLFSKDGQDEFPFESWNATALYFYDPDDNLMEFIAHHTLDNAADEAFGPKHLLRISEIGLPVDDVPEAARKLTNAFQLSLWGGDGQQFAPLGDAEGVLIVEGQAASLVPGRKGAGSVRH
jgi:catechol-2,3-dioxygenase